MRATTFTLADNAYSSGSNTQPRQLPSHGNRGERLPRTSDHCNGQQLPTPSDARAFAYAHTGPLAEALANALATPNPGSVPVCNEYNGTHHRTDCPGGRQRPHAGPDA